MQDRTHSFGYWLRRRRKALDLTQEALAIPEEERRDFLDAHVR